MRKLMILFMAVSLLASCDSKKNERVREKSSDSREKDDYRDNKTSDDREKPSNDDTDRPAASWNRSDETKFMRECEGTAAEKVGAARASEYCDCMLQKIKGMYSSYSEADRELANATDDDVQRLAKDCNPQ